METEISDHCSWPDCVPDRKLCCQFSLIWWLASETGSPMMMALSGLVAFLPQIFLGPFAGVLPEKYFAGIIRPYSAAK